MLENPINPETLNRFWVIVQQYDPSYYCTLSYCIGVVPPKKHSLIKNLEPYFLLSVFTYINSEGADPQVCAVQASTTSELARKAHFALGEVGEGKHPSAWAPSTPEQAVLLLSLIMDERTCAPTRVECFQQLAPLLSQGGSIEMANMLMERIASRLPGAPGFAAMHGLLGEGKD